MYSRDLLEAGSQSKESRQSLSLHDGCGCVEYSIISDVRMYYCNRRYNESRSDRRRIEKKGAKKRMTLALKMTTRY